MISRDQPPALSAPIAGNHVAAGSSGSASGRCHLIFIDVRDCEMRAGDEGETTKERKGEREMVSEKVNKSERRWQRVSERQQVKE